LQLEAENAALRHQLIVLGCKLHGWVRPTKPRSLILYCALPLVSVNPSARRRPTRQRY
jgi:hypothetical protein